MSEKYKNSIWDKSFKLSRLGHEICSKYVLEKFGKDRFDNGEHVGGNTELGLYGRWYNDKDGYSLQLTADIIKGEITQAELVKNGETKDLLND